LGVKFYLFSPDERFPMAFKRSEQVVSVKEERPHKCSLILFWLVSANGAFFGFFWGWHLACFSVVRIWAAVSDGSFLAMLDCILPRNYTDALQEGEPAALKRAYSPYLMVISTILDSLTLLSQTKPEKPLFEKNRPRKDQ